MRMTAAARRLLARPADLAAGAVRLVVRLAAAVLAGFHIWLFGLHLLDGRAFEPPTAVRWVVALLVVAGFRALSRRGVPLFFSQRAVGLWLVVVIIHCSAALDARSAARLEAAIPEAVTALAQLSVSALVLGAAAAAAVAAAARPRAGCRPAFAVPAFIAGLPAAGSALCFAPRPPPLA